MNLVIVESPAKGRTIARFLGEDYKVVASFGHVRDLPQKELGVDVDHDFKPHYIAIPRAEKTIAKLKEAAAGAKEIYLATDYDREGEAIAWHIMQAIGLQTQNSKLKTQNYKRIVFHEITQQAIEEAVQNPRELDLKLVDAQQARRILDRLVGYKLSPFLWEKVFKGLSAGRVQSVAVRLIVDREREIEGFVSQDYWTILGDFAVAANDVQATLVRYEGKDLEKLAIGSRSQANQMMEILKKSSYKVAAAETKEELKWSFPPFTTSSLQQDANRRLGFSSKKTMKLAQQLYESGYITYMRTDSMNLAWVAVNTTRKLIEQEFGKQYLSEKPRQYRTKAVGAQEAHEAIRPTYIDRKTLGAPAKKGKTKKAAVEKWRQDHKDLYQLIWNRMVACQMAPAKLSVSHIDIQAGDNTFRRSGQTITFDGWLKVYPIKIEEKPLVVIKPGESAELKELTAEPHATEPPRRYSEATLVKALEEHGIGRPSTYAPIISTIQDRGYVRLQNRVFYPEQAGTIVTDVLKTNFSDIVDIGFTAELEGKLDAIAEGAKDWHDVLREFYEPFAKNLAEKYTSVTKDESIQNQASGEKCSKCNRDMVVRLGRFGQFLACSGYPECKNTKSLIAPTGINCPDCKQGEILQRRSRHGKVFWGCSRYPECKWSSWENPTINQRLEIKNQNEKENIKKS
ncbi:type I DNA topoisomerase [Candidatus Berkelbacteria bacterium]|nr:type I DNA topoisomerase [Candidatus Berkelbacteria bacterium]